MPRGERKPAGTLASEDGLPTSDVSSLTDSFLREVAAIPEPLAEEPNASRSLREGDLLSDRFIIERLAGRGGMGIIYRALDQQTGERLAIKVLARREGNADRFSREAHLLAELADPAVVRYVSHGQTPLGEPFLAMEWLDGEDLANRLVRGPLSVTESVTVARRVARGLAIAHTRGIVHRDVKPSNVFLVDGDPSRAKLLDFGIARLHRHGLSSSVRALTRTGAVVGSVGYMAPEQAMADPSIDARADVFGLGCLLFECLTGQPAFYAEHLLSKILFKAPPRASDLQPRVPAQLDDLVARTLSKDRSGRPADGAAMLRELNALDAPPADASPSGSVPPNAAGDLT
ncbi:MAG TPA: serine/threonine-protein kinase [Polyangiaceae bacterium]|nr:serine/threonine-protein kinase [Polyangiaceae bacterium]